MKMMKTDMEFVTFDAQDVITTSGPIPTPTGISFKVTGGLLDLSDTNWEYDGDSAFWLSGGDGEFNISGVDGVLTDGNYYTIAEGAKYGYTFHNEYPDGTYGGNLTFYSGLTAGNTGAVEKTTLSSILEWLESNGVQ